MAFLLSLLALVAAFLPSTLAQSGAGWQIYNFCYLTQNTLSTSPYLLWTVWASGAMNLSTTATTGFGAAYNQGFQVYGMSGTREVYVQGKALQSNAILGVTPQQTYGANDNRINTTAPFLVKPHAVTFYLDGVAQFAAGPAVYPNQLQGSRNVSINSFAEYREGDNADISDTFAESDNPPNDRIANVITGGIQLVLSPSGGMVSSYACSAYTRPTAAPANTAAAIAAYQTTLTWYFCYQFQAGGFDVAQTQYLTATSGTITTTGLIGASPSGAATGYLALRVNGTRSLTYISNVPSVGSRTYSVNLQAIGSPLSAYFMFPTYRYGTYESDTQSSSGHYTYANNILYPAFPQVDLFGLAIIADGPIPDEWSAQGNNGAMNVSDTQVFMMYTDNSYIIYDTVYSLTPGYYIYADPSYVDSLVVQTATQYAATKLTGAAWATATCGATYIPNPTRYSFCYFIDNSAAGIPTAERGLTSMYGTFTARTGLVRYGKAAMQIQGLTGIRSTFSQQTNSASSQSVVQIEAPNALWPGYYWLTDNVLFTQAPWFSEAGLMLTFSDISNVTFLGTGAVPVRYMNLFSTWSTSTSATAAGLYEASVNSAGVTNFYSGLTKSGFNYTAFVPGQLAQCNLLDNKVTMATQNYSFCWFRQSTAGYINTFSAVITAYTTPLYRNGRPGYVVQTMTGLRTYVDSFGVVNSVTLGGLAGDGIATTYAGFQSPSFGTQSDNLIYDSFPYLDGEGLTYQVNGPLGDFIRSLTQDTGNGGVGYSSGNGLALDNVGRLYYDESGSGNYYYDESLYNITSLYNSTTGADVEDLWSFILLTGPPSNVKIIPDGGAAANAGNMLQTQCNAPTYQLFSFCYSLQQTLPNSPYLPWTVFVTGTLNISMVATAYWVGGSGYKVVGATGSRTILYGGKNITNRIIGVAPTASWNWNDNEINLAAPFLTSIHVVSFVLDGPAHFAGGPIPGLTGANSTYFSISNFTQAGETTLGAVFNEDDQPINGQFSSVTSKFDLRLYLAGTSVCPFTPPVPTYTASALQAYQTVTQKALCFSVSGAPGGYSNLPGGAFTTITSLILNVTSFGASTSGVAAYLILSGAGTRTFIYADGTNVTANVVVGGINAGLHAFPNFFIGGSIQSFASNNLYYPTSTYPLDSYGIQVVGDRDLINEYEGDYNSNVARMYWSGVDWEEMNVDFSTIGHPTYGTYYYSFSGALIISPYTAGMDMNAFGQQCTAYYGGLSTFSFCYAIDGSAATTPFVSYAYGLLQADGPQLRNNRSAYAVRGMTGVRSIYTSGQTYQNNIMNVQYLDQDTVNGGVFRTDNLIYYPQGVPEISILGIAFNMSQPALFAGAVSGAFSSLIISTDGAASGNNLYEQVGGGTQAYIYANKYQFSLAPYTSGSTLGVSCAGLNSNVAAAPTLISYPFCYAMNGPDNYGYQISVSGTITVYSTPIPVGSLTAYAVANVTGSRSYTDGMGRTFNAVITGLSQDWIAEQQGWTYDQLLYTTGSPVDAQGILYKFGGFINNNNPSAVTYDRVVRFYADGQSPVVEEYYNTNGSVWTPTFVRNNAQVSLGGSTTSTTCTSKLPSNGYTGPAYVPPSNNNGGNNSTGGGGSGSGLSNGAIAGIVIGTCVGACLFCIVCFLLGMTSGGAKKKGEDGTTSKNYDSQVDHSRMGNSQVVELQTAESSRVGEAETHDV